MGTAVATGFPGALGIPPRWRAPKTAPTCKGPVEEGCTCQPEGLESSRPAGRRAAAQTKSELSESARWMRAMASPKRRSVVSTRIFEQDCAVGDIGTVSVKTTSSNTESVMR